MAHENYRPAFAPHRICEHPRHAKLARHRDYYRSQQYRGRADWWTGLNGQGQEVPLRERKPCVIYPLPRSATNQVVRFTFGESRFPSLSVDVHDEEDSQFKELNVSEDEAETLEDFIAELVDRSRLKPGMRRVMRPGVATGTACVIVSLKRGVFALQVANAEDVLPKFKNDDPTDEVEGITWCYRFQKVVEGADGRPEEKEHWFRQDVTDVAFVEYEPVEIVHGEEPVWRVKNLKPHGFGVCPVVWIRNLLDEDSGDLDGVSLYEGLHDEFDALNFTLSQRHRGVHHLGVPQPWETGVEDDDGPGETGRTSGPAGYSAKHGAVAAPRPARPTGSVVSWRYRGKDVRLGLLETSGKAFEVASLHVNDIRARVLEAMSVVLVNVSDVMGRTQQGEMSAKFLELAYEPLLALVDEMRHHWWFDGLYKILSLMLRITAALGGERILIPGATQAAKILQRFTVQTTEGPLWIPPKLTPGWGPYFAAGPEEVSLDIDNASKARDAGLWTKEDAVKHVAAHAGREDIPELLEELESEAQEALELMHELAGPDDGSSSGETPGRDRSGASGDAAQDARGGSGDAALAPKKGAASGANPGAASGARAVRKPKRGGSKRPG